MKNYEFPLNKPRPTTVQDWAVMFSERFDIADHNKEPLIERLYEFAWFVLNNPHHSILPDLPHPEMEPWKKKKLTMLQWAARKVVTSEIESATGPKGEWRKSPKVVCNAIVRRSDKTFIEEFE